MSRIIVFLFIYQLVSTASSQGGIENIDAYIEQAYRPFHRIPGLGLAIIKDNGDTLNVAKGYGMRNFEDGLPADGNTRFPIGSISKGFTSALVVKTLHEKFPTLPNFGLDVPIVELLPSYNFTMNDRFRSESVTFRDLLSHRVCSLPTSLTLSLDVYTSRQDVAYRQRYAEEVCSFRTALIYNNGLIEFAAELVATLANASFNDMLRSFFEELGMNDTVLVTENEDYDTFPNMTRGYYLQDGIMKRHNPQLLNRLHLFAGAGGILSTPNDMKAYMMFHLNKGRVGNRQVVPEEAMALVRESSNIETRGGAKTTPNSPYDLTYSYSLCLFNSIHDGWERLWHTGYFPPYSSLMSFYPSLNLGVFITTNGPGLFHLNLGHQLLHLEIYNLIMKGTPYNSSTGIQRLKQNMETITTKSMPKSSPIHEKNPRVEADDIVGLYGNGLEGEFVISAAPNATDENISISYGKWGAGNVIRRSDSLFLIDWTTDFVSDMLTYQDGSEKYESLLNFSGNDTVTLYSEEAGFSITYKKDQTLDKLPVVPWAPGSCSPTDD